MHEVESVLVLIEELVWASFYVDGIYPCTSGEGVFENTTVLEVTEFCLYESWTFSRFYMLEVNEHARFAVEVKVHSVFEISCCCHIL